MTAVPQGAWLKKATSATTISINLNVLKNAEMVSTSDLNMLVMTGTPKVEMAAALLAKLSRGTDVSVTVVGLVKKYATLNGSDGLNAMRFHNAVWDVVNKKGAYVIRSMDAERYVEMRS